MIRFNQAEILPLFLASMAIVSTACGPQTVASTETVLETGSSLRTKADLKALGLDINHANSCAQLDTVASEVDWNEDALLLLDLMAANCSVPTEDITPADALAALGENNVAMSAEGNVLTLFQRTKGNPPLFCCSLQDLPNRAVIDDTVWVARQRLRDLDGATINMTATLTNLDPEGYDMQSSGLEGTASWIGPNAIKTIDPIPDDELLGAVTEHEVYSPQLQETRRISVYTPPNASPDLPIIIVADGDTLAGTVERLMRGGEIRPVLVVGIASGQDGIVEDRSAIGDNNELRSYDYIPGEVYAKRENAKAGTRFDDHLRFVSETLLDWVASEFGVRVARERTVVAGWSNGGSFALNAGFRRNDVFGHAWPMSVGLGSMNEAQDVPPGAKARFRFSAGHYEPGFMRGTRVSAGVLAELGYETETKWYAEGHGSGQWNARFADNLRFVFPAVD